MLLLLLQLPPDECGNESKKIIVLKHRLQFSSALYVILVVNPISEEYKE